MTHPHGHEPAAERWREEMTAAWLYRALATAERDPVRSRLFESLESAAKGQAAIIARDMAGAPPAFVPPMRARLVAAIARAVTPRRARPILAAMKVRGLSAFGVTPAGHAMPLAVGELERRHQRGTGGTLRAAVFGANDGLVSNTCLIFGVAGAETSAQVLVLTGIAGLLAGAFSMAAGEYVSMRSQREMYEH